MTAAVTLHAPSERSARDASASASRSETPPVIGNKGFVDLCAVARRAIELREGSLSGASRR